MTERNFPAGWHFNQDKGLLPGTVPLGSSENCLRKHRLSTCCATSSDPSNIAIDSGNRVLWLIFDVDTSVLVLLPAPSFIGFERLRTGFLDHARVGRVQRIHLVEVERLDGSLVRDGYIYCSLLIGLWRRGTSTASRQNKRDHHDRCEKYSESSLHVDLSGEARRSRGQIDTCSQ